MLPKYLQFPTPNAGTPSAQTVVCGDCRFSVITSRLIRMERHAFTDAATLVMIDRSFCTPAFTAKENDGVLTILTDDLSLRYVIGAPFTADTLSIRLQQRPYTEWHFGDRPLQNLGGTVSTLDQINGSCPIDDGVCSIDGYALIDDSQTTLFDPDGWFCKRESGVTDLYFFGYGHDYTAAVQDYYRLTGKQEMLPAYAFGNWWSRYNKYTEESYLELMDTFRKEDLPFSIGIVDMDWHITDGDGRDYLDDGWTGYTWNRELFPDPKRFLDGLKQRNIRTALNLHPAAGVRSWDDDYEEMAKRMGIDSTTGHPVPFNCLSQEFWKAYFEVLHFPKEADGVSFWWMDWQQGTDYCWMHVYDPEKQDLECLHPLWMLNHMHTLAAKRDGKRGLFFSRYAGYGSQRYPIGFSGDTIITWDSLRFQPYFTATASNIGYGYWSHDLGGHMQGCRDDELNTRWIQFGVFSPIFRMHSSNSPYTCREPWTYSKQADPILRRFMRLRHQLFPYIYTMAYRNYRELLPLIRPLYHTNPEDREAYSVPNVYWFGSELIAAPITEKGDAVTGTGRATVWLPEGSWVDWFTGFVYRGGETFDAYRTMETMPLFCKAGAIVPMQAHVPHENKLGRSENLEIVIAAGDSNEFELYEDDGESNDYQRGIGCCTKMTLDWQETTARFTVHPISGNADLVPQTRQYTLFLKGFASTARFSAGGRNIDATRDPINGEWTVTIGEVDAKTGFTVTMDAAEGLLSQNVDYYERAMDILLHAQCENEIKGKWEEVLNDAKDNQLIDKPRYACAHNNHLGGAMLELMQQVIRKQRPFPTPGLPKPFEK